MMLLRAATLSVADVDRAAESYAAWLDYEVVESGTVSDALAQSWGAPASAGHRMTVLHPASAKANFLRLVETTPHPAYLPLRSHGWAAIEICVQDVLAVDERLRRSPFQTIGPPREIEGLDAIHAMQVRGPDGEIVYLTEIRSDLPEFDLPRATVPIDSLFILVMGCSDLRASLEWMRRYAGMEFGCPNLQIAYTMLAKAYGTPEDELHTISTMVHGRDVFLELDQYPAAAVARERHSDELPPGVCIGTFAHPAFATLAGAAGQQALAPADRQPGCIYAGRESITMAAPDGALVELVDGSDLRQCQ